MVLGCPHEQKLFLSETSLFRINQFGREAPAEERPNLASPSPNVRRDKISRSGEPLTLIITSPPMWGSEYMKNLAKADLFQHCPNMLAPHEFVLTEIP